MAVPLVEIGRNLAITIAPVSVSGTTGVITVSTLTSMAGKAKRGAKRSRRRTFEAMPLDAVIVNNVPFVDDWVVELSQIRRTGPALSNVLDTHFFQGAFAQIVITSFTSIDTYVGCLVNFDWEMVQEENIESLVMIPIDIGAANPARTLPP